MNFITGIMRWFRDQDAEDIKTIVSMPAPNEYQANIINNHLRWISNQNVWSQIPNNFLDIIISKQQINLKQFHYLYSAVRWACPLPADQKIPKELVRPPILKLTAEDESYFMDAHQTLLTQFEFLFAQYENARTARKAVESIDLIAFQHRMALLNLAATLAAAIAAIASAVVAYLTYRGS